MRVGTRGSALALAQATKVVAFLANASPASTFSPVVIKTEGDIDQVSPLTVIGGRGVFTSRVQTAVLNGTVDLAVHSAKDLPPIEPMGLVLAAFPEREDPRDVLISRHGVGMAQLPSAPRIGTSSRRRAMQVRLARPDAQIVDLRGNVDTRLRKAAQDDLDGIVIAAAGLVRLGLADRVTEWLALDQFLPAPGQGAMAVETRADDYVTRSLVEMIDLPVVSLPVRAERAFLRALGAGCMTPLGAHVGLDRGTWVLSAMLGDLSGERVERIQVALDAERPEVAATAAAAELLQRMGTRQLRIHLPAAVLIEEPIGPPHLVSPAQPAMAAAPGDSTDKQLPLAGLRVVVTRTPRQAAPLVEALRTCGAEPISLPTIRMGASPTPERFRALMAEALRGRYQWLIFTSGNAVRAAMDTLDGIGADELPVGAIKIAAVGRQTAALLGEQRLPVSLVANPPTAEGLLAALQTVDLVGCRVLYPHGNLASDAFLAGLRAAGADVDAVVAYTTERETEVDPAVLAQVQAGDIDVVTFASPSSVRSMMALLDGRNAVPASARVVCIGPVTAAAARESGLRVDAVAADPSVPGVLAAIAASCP